MDVMVRHEQDTRPSCVVTLLQSLQTLWMEEFAASAQSVSEVLREGIRPQP